MPDALHYIFGHNAWANLRLLEALRSLSDDQLGATSEAVYGDVRSTMQHLVGSESYYWSVFSGHFPDWAWPDDVPATLEQLESWALDLQMHWHELLSQPLDADSWLERTRRDGSISRLKAGIVLAQCIHHGNVHREQISHVLTTLGLTPPDLSLYAYGRDTGGAMTIDAPKQ
jgi:uncharacterized damage-inducible protein DinB